MAIAATSVFVGRQTELRALHDGFAEATGGRSLTVLVEGEAGIGKTTLVEHFLTQVHATRILRASGDESESHVPFAVADQLLRSAGRAGGARGAQACLAGTCVFRRVLAPLRGPRRCASVATPLRGVAAGLRQRRRRAAHGRRRRPRAAGIARVARRRACADASARRR